MRKKAIAAKQKQAPVGAWCRRWPPPSGAKLVLWLHEEEIQKALGGADVTIYRVVGIWRRKERDVVLRYGRRNRLVVNWHSPSKPRWWRTK